MVAGTLRGAVEWVVAALSAAGVTSSEVAERLAPRLAARGDLTEFFGANRRFAAFREHQAVIEGIETPGPWTARAAVRTGPLLWELDVAVEPDPPHRIRSFQPRPVAPDAVPWTRIAAGLRAYDRAESALPAPAAQRIHERLLHAVGAHRIVGMAAAVGVGPETVHRETLGVADLETRSPVDSAAVFRVGSVTKAVTALAVLRLAETGTVDPHSPIDAYVAGPVLVPPVPGGGTPTVAELLLHRGGLPKDLAVSRAPLLAGAPLAQVAPRIDMAWPSGGRPEYSNVGYEILGALIEVVLGDSYAAYCSREVLPRLGMAGACVQRPGAAAPATVTGYRVAAGHVAPAPPAVAPYPAAGGMTAGVGDLLALAGAFGTAADPLVRTALAMTAPAGAGTRFAPGVAFLDRPAGTLMWRAGATDGFTAEVLAALDGSVRVVLAAAKSPPDGLRAVGMDLIGLLRDS